MERMARKFRISARLRRGDRSHRREVQKESSVAHCRGAIAQRNFFHPNRGRGHVQRCKRSPHSTLFTQEEFDGGTIPIFCTKPTSPEETHDHWITRLRTKGKDCEFDNMTLDEAIKLVVTLHTPSDKLQRDIIAKDMDLKTVIESAREKY